MAASTTTAQISSNVAQGVSTTIMSVEYSLYQLNSVPGKGFGIFATCDIPRGTRIISESPLLILPRGGGPLRDRLEVPLHMKSLTQADKTKFFSLIATSNAPEIKCFIDLVKTAHKFFPGIQKSTLPLGAQVKAMIIHEVNAFGAGPNASAMAFEASRLNHSCTPNVYHCWNETLRQLTVQTIRDVLAGEELTTTYINACAFSSYRAQALESYKFACDCPACDSSTCFGTQSDKNRELLCAYNRALVRPYMEPGMWPKLSWLESVWAEREMVRLLIGEGIVNMELTRHYRALARLYALKRKYTEACMWQRYAVELTRICCGVDAGDFFVDAGTLEHYMERKAKAPRSIR